MPQPFTLDHRTFPNTPADEQLGALLGDASFAQAIEVRESDGELVLRLPRPPPSVALVVILVGVAVTTLPLWWPKLDAAQTGRHASLLWGLIIFMWLAIIPGILALLWWMKRRAESRLPGAIVDKRTRSLRLPRFGRVVEQSAVAYVAEVQRPYRQNGTGDSVVQLSVVLYEPDRTYSQWPIETFMGRHLFRAKPAERLADALEVRLKRVKLGRKAAKSVDASG